uniref:Uncharacterized protein n=1 Tax=Dictyostelium citrinum TaxID=361072 RepID=B2VQ26_DICCI|nr:hypothetical protein [Dictyostelium citrinum]
MKNIFNLYLQKLKIFKQVICNYRFSDNLIEMRSINFFNIFLKTADFGLNSLTRSSEVLNKGTLLQLEREKVADWYKSVEYLVNKKNENI